jgi:hypothetical protein
MPLFRRHFRNRDTPGESAESAGASWQKHVPFPVLGKEFLPVEIIGVVAEKPSSRAKENQPTIYYDYANQPDPTPNRTALARFRAPTSSELVSVDFDTNVVSPEYFKAMGLWLLAGRLFTEHQTPGEFRIGVVNQEAANLYFAGEPLGAAVIDDQGTRTAIVGVVHSRPLGTLQRRAEPQFIFRCHRTGNGA